MEKYKTFSAPAPWTEENQKALNDFLVQCKGSFDLQWFQSSGGQDRLRHMLTCVVRYYTR